MDSPSVYDHLQPTDLGYPDGTYRVVGTSEDAVTLLRVADADGRRVNTGEIVTVDSDDLDEFGPAENPDGNRPLGAVVASKLEMTYWSVRVFVQQLATNPLPTAVAVTLVMVGSFGERVLSLPDIVITGLILVGSLGLAYVGSGRPSW